VAQFDVYVNPNPASRDVVPYVVDVQSRLLSATATRLMVPLRRLSAAHADLPRRLVPQVQVRSEAFVLYAHQAAPVEARLLKKSVVSLAGQSADIVGAIDAVISGV
jgi:toxin CcdB